MPSWRDTLLAIDDDHVGTRAEGWRTTIERSPAAVEAFASGVAAITELDLGDIERTLTHGDLVNFNVHVVDGRITGIFDWGCLRWGDHLYDLAWFDFWSPWHPQLDIALLRAELDRRWDDAGHTIDRRTDRERACLTHIGLDHLIYNSTIESWSDLDDVVQMMNDLDLI